MSFCNLHGHTTFSFLDGMGTPAQICQRITDLGQKCVAVTDHGNVFAHVPYMKAARKYDGLKVIYGLEGYIVPDLKDRSPVVETRGAGSFPHITLLARTQHGYSNLMKLHKLSWQEGFYYKPRIDIEMLWKHQEGLTVLSGCVGGLPLTYLRAEKLEECHKHLDLMKNNIESYYAEFVPTPGEHWNYKENKFDSIPGYLLSKLAQMAYELNIPCVMTSDAHFPAPEHHIIEDMMLCVGTGQKVYDNPRKIQLANYHFYGTELELIQRSKDMYFNASDEWIQWSINNSSIIADQCDFVEIPKAGKFKYIGLNLNETPESKLWELVIQGVKIRFHQGKISQENNDVYYKRACYEYAILKKKGFCDYILCVNDIVQHSKNMNELVMLRGSAAGCLLLWLIGSSETDPILHKLSFERFFDENRQDPPDVDMDFEKRKREEHINYIFNKYGEENCAQISNVSELRAKQAVVDTARVLGIPRSEYAPLSAALDSADEEVDKQIDALEDQTAKEVLMLYPQLRLAAGMVGQFRQSSVHAAGIIISPNPLGNSIGIVKQNHKRPIVSIDKKGASDLGYLKFDLLSVNAYDIIAATLRKLNYPVSMLYDLPLDDSNVYRVANAGKLAGVFQLSGGSALRVSRKIGLDTFEDLYAASALCRPGPSELVEVYADNKHNPEEFKHYLQMFHPIVQDIVKDTYGVMIYQEQVMRIARELACLDWPDVHKLRKGIQDKLGLIPGSGAIWEEEWKEKFISGCMSNHTISENEVLYIWDNIKKYGGYGFNKCVTGDTVVVRAGSSQYNSSPEITIEELFSKQNSNTSIGKKIRSGKLNIMQMSEDGRIKPSKLKKVYYQGKQQVLKIVTEKGKEISVTANHKLLTNEGYVEAGNLTINSILIVMGEKETRIKKGYQTKRAIGKKYYKEGFCEGEKNPAYIDGRNIYFKKAKQIVIERSKGKCESCGKENKNNRFEFAHIHTLEFLNGDYKEYHNYMNLYYLCNSCHKTFDYAKGERKIRFSKGLPTSQEKIISISCDGIKDTYDIEMDTQEHNFIANGIVSHNSHACTYGLISYWMLWLKTYFTDSFYETYLQNDTENKTRKSLIREYTESGGKVMLFDLDRPTQHFTCVEPKRIVGGFAELKGIGDVVTYKALQSGKTGTEFLNELGESYSRNIQNTGALSGNWDVQRLIALAPWFPVPTTGKKEKEMQDNSFTPISYLIEHFGTAFNGDISLLGYVTETDVDEEKIVFTLEDEGGFITARVPLKRVTELRPMFESFRVGDYVAVEGWFSGEVLYIKHGVIALAAPDIKLENRNRKVSIAVEKNKVQAEKALERWNRYRKDNNPKRAVKNKEYVENNAKSFIMYCERIKTGAGEEIFNHWLESMGKVNPYTVTHTYMGSMLLEKEIENVT